MCSALKAVFTFFCNGAIEIVMMISYRCRPFSFVCLNHFILRLLLDFFVLLYFVTGVTLLLCIQNLILDCPLLSNL